MRRFVTVLAVLAVAIPLTAVAIAAWVLYTPGGLRWAVEQATRRSEGALALDYESGTLRDGVRFGSVRFASETLALDAAAVYLRLSPWSLLRLRPHVSELTAERVHLRMRADDAPAPQSIEIPALPIALEVASARVAQLTIERDDESFTLHEIFLRYAADADHHRLRDLGMRVHGFAVAADATLGARAPHTIEGRITARRDDPAPSFSATVEARGSLERLAIALDAQSAGARLSAQGEIAPADAQPVRSLQASITDLDVRAFDPTLPETRLAASVTLQNKNGRLVGPAEIANAIPGPQDAGRLPVSAARARIATDLVEFSLEDLVVQLTEGHLAGSAHYTGARAQLQLTGHDIDLAALHGRLHETRLNGDAHAIITDDQQSVSARLEQDDMRVRLRLSRKGEDAVLHEATLHARGGEARASGRIALAGERPFSAKVLFQRFDPAAWGDFPQGSVNATLEARGSAAGPQVRARFALVNSRLNNVALSGKGRGAWSAQRLADIDAVIQLGSNRATLRGAFGAARDVLTVRADAGALRQLHPEWNGRVRGEARITGTFATPHIRFDAHAEALNVAGTAVSRARANGTLAFDPAAPLNVHVHVSGLAAGERRVDEAVLEVGGTQREHAAALRAAASGLELDMRARGGWDAARRAWSGKLMALSTRGTLEATLDAPVAVKAAARHIELGRFTLRLADGRFDIAEARYTDGRISTRGEFSQFPLLAVARALQVAPRAGGTLRLSGTWSLVRDSVVTGRFVVRRDAGDVTLGPNGALPLGLRALAIEGDIDASRFQLRATLASGLVNLEAAGTLGLVSVEGRPGFAPESPLRAQARIAVTELGAMATLVDANALFGGALDATLAARGTLGKPLLTGEVRGERLAIALPPLGIDLRGGTLRAALQERTIRIDALTIRGGEGEFSARGTLGLNGANSELEWRAERLLVLGRPDRRLVVSGKGRAAMRDGKVTLAGGLRADSGYFEIGPDALPEPGADVIVAGRAPAPKPEPALARTLLELVVNLGEDFRVRGRGLDTRVTGEITVATGPKGNLRAKGKLSTVRGVYVALGQRLEIERGELIFTGPLDNPGLDIRAMRKRQAVEAGVAVTGTLDNPLVRIVSEPPVTESEAISWLVLGHGTGDASRGDLAMLPLAASSLMGKSGSPTLAQRFGLDTLTLRGAGTESQALAVGKRIADRLYVGFEQSLGAAASILKLEFDLTQHVLVRAQTGETNSLGVFYRYSFD